MENKILSSGLTLRIAIFSLWAILCQTSLAEVSTRTEYYSIAGSSARQLFNEMNRKGPEGFSGYTTREYSYEYRTRIDNGRCRASRLRLDVDILYSMPRWENKSSADQRLQTQWETWYRILDQHERNHGAYAEKGYDDILTGWRGIRSSENCQDIRNQVEQIYRSISERVRQENADYDRITNHGETEGVTFNTLAGDDSSSGIVSSRRGVNYWWIIFAALIGLFFYVRRS